MLLLTQVSLPLTSPVTTITGLLIPGTLTGGAWSVRTTAVDERLRVAPRLVLIHSVSDTTHTTIHAT